LVAAIDQGTSSTRFLVFNAKTAEMVCQHQVEIHQSFPKEGWVEEDPREIIQSVYECIERTCEKLVQLNVSVSSIKAVGVTNQRETTLVWDKETGEPLYRAIVWLDLRTQSTVESLINKAPGKDKNHLKVWKKKKSCVYVCFTVRLLVCVPLTPFSLQSKTGLPISTYFSAVKLRWLLDNVAEVRQAVLSGRAVFGTVDSWIIWCLTGGSSGGVHCTDVTNASRTMLFNIHTMDWDSELCRYFDVPMEILPTIRSSSEIYGYLKSSSLAGVPISGCLGDQSAALVGQRCFKEGQAKNTYGTGCFMLKNTGTTVRREKELLSLRFHRCLHHSCSRSSPSSPTTACSPQSPTNSGKRSRRATPWRCVSTSFCLELILTLAEVSLPSPSGFCGHCWGRGAMAAGQHGHYSVLGRDRDAGSNSWNVIRLLLCPSFLWTLRPLLGAKCTRVKQLLKQFAVTMGVRTALEQTKNDGRDLCYRIICGLTQFTNKSHLAFAALEAVCFQTREILDAMNQDSRVPLTQLQVDGGMTSNRLLMQLQADILCTTVVRPTMSETTALGAAMAAGAAEGVNVWSLSSSHLPKVTCEAYEPQINLDESEFRFARWKKAVQRSMNWETTEAQ
ncbi:unnamed protein product, partial [Tetraodon nigroviridis]